MTNPPPNNNYLAGYLEQSFKTFHHVLEREAIIKWNSPEYKKVMDLIDKELKKAYEAEREFSKDVFNR
jgi:hypothetical protein